MPHTADSEMTIDGIKVVDMAEVETQAQCPMHFIVVGDSVAGVAVAFTLVFAGHKVTVVEAVDKDTRTMNKLSDGGVRFPPSITRRLIAYPGVLDILRKKGTKVNSIEFRSDTDQVCGRLPLEADLVNDLGSDFFLVPYHDYTDGRRFCVANGADYHYNFKVARIETPEKGPAAVISEDGERLEGDVIIGADGRNSVVRQHILQEGVERDNASDPMRGMVPCKELIGGAFPILMEDIIPYPELQELVDANKYIIWMGDKCVFTGGRYGPTYILSVVQFVPQTPKDVEVKDAWEQSTLASFMSRLVPESNNILKKLISIAKDGHPTIEQFQPLDSFVDKHWRAVVIGDAAHCTPMHGTHNSAIAVEDALALEKLLGHLTDPAQMPMFLRAYNELRLPRSRIVSNFEIARLEEMMVGPGPLRDARDVEMKQTLESPFNPELLPPTWLEWIELADYDVYDDVNEWWLMWGRHGLEMLGGHSESGSEGDEHS